MTVGLGLSDHRVPESDSGSARWHTAAAMTVPQCGMGRGLTTDERAGTDTLSEAWLAQRLFTGTSHRDGPTHWHRDCRPASGVPLTGSLSGSRLRPSQMLKRNFKLNLKYDPVVTVPSSAVTLA